MKKINYIIEKLILKTCSLLSFIIPKRKGLLVFRQIHNNKQFSGNVKSLLLYIKNNCNNKDCYFLANNSSIGKEVKNEGIPVIKNKLFSFWYILRAEHIILDATVSHYFNWNLSIIQLWHGTGFKNIGLLKGHYGNSSTFERMKKHYKTYDLIIATSKSDKKRKEDSFNSNKVKITGSPRNDIFFNGPDFDLNLRKRYGVDNYDRIITYTPTFRDYETIPPFTDSFWNSLNEYLVETNAIFIVKKHPWDKYLKVPHNFENIRDLSSEIADVQELLIISDVLISDYSGIISDFAITNKPILLYMYDLEVYLDKCRSIYFDLNEILPKPFIFNETELLNKIKDESWLKTEEYQISYKAFRERFHKYLDGNSSKRVMQEIEKL